MRTILYKDSDQLIDELDKISIERIPFRYIKRYEFRQAIDPNGFIFIEAALKA